jgi:hypothetical protein
MDQVTGLRYGVNVGQWIRDYPHYVLRAGFDALGYSARRRNEHGRPAGSPIGALTLDELAARVDEQEAQPG